MPENCSCNIAANFPVLGADGVISAGLRTNTNITVTEGGLVLYGPTVGDLSVTAYGRHDTSLRCPGRAGSSYSWNQRLSCENGELTIYFIPGGKSKAYTEGDVISDIRMTEIDRLTYEMFSASAASGPTSVYLRTTHKDGYDLSYSGPPLFFDADVATETFNKGIFSSILPTGSEIYLSSFSWNYEPPNIPTVSYSFIFSYNIGG